MTRLLRDTGSLACALAWMMACSSSQSVGTDGGLDDGGGPDTGADTGSGGQDSGADAARDAGRDAGDAGSGDGGGRDADTTARCTDSTCDDPAECDDSDGTPKCVCPEGYTDESDDEDGSDCQDIDECLDVAFNDCDDNAECVNTPGSYECNCDGPAWEGDGESCDCADGYTLESGLCVGGDGMACGSDDHCESGHCIGGTCCATVCDSPGMCEVAEGAACDDGSTCTYAPVDDGTACDDSNACTVDDQCTAGACDGATRDCDDGNLCTADSCDTATGCINDGTDVMTTGCLPDDKCGSNYVCVGDAAGTCWAGTAVDCTHLDSDCNVGMCDPSDGSCMTVAQSEGGACNDGNACTIGETCTAGVCGGGTTRDCSDGNPCTQDVCDAGTGCQNPNLDPSTTCDDSDLCTAPDVCGASATCAGAPVDCSAMDDACNVGVCDGTDGSCMAVASNEGGGCDDSDPCTTGETCGSGTCGGGSDTCGDHGTCSSPGGPGYICVCEPGYIVQGGTCVEDVCSGYCDTNATCVVVSGSPQCTCDPGYQGDGLATGGTGCTDIDECVGNPCGAGRGTCSQNAPGAGYSCSCNSGLMEVAGTCVCDLNGTYAMEVTTHLGWTGIPNVEDSNTDAAFMLPAKVETTSWAIRTHTYTSSGELTVDTKSCGATTPELCGVNPLLGNETYAQYQPNSAWESAAMPLNRQVVTGLTGTIPGAVFQTPDHAALLGINLTDPMGAWPARNNDVGGSSPTNGAVWVNHDGDAWAGVTIETVPPGGVAAGPSGPPISYGATGAECNRTMAGSPAYAYLPGLEGLSVRRVKRVFAGSRLISSLDGVIDAASCDLITGAVKGPGPTGQMQSDARFVGCIRCSGTDCSSETDCSGSLVDFYDNTEQAQQVISASFILKRVASTVSCNDVRNSVAFP